MSLEWSGESAPWHSWFTRQNEQPTQLVSITDDAALAKAEILQGHFSPTHLVPVSEEIYNKQPRTEASLTALAEIVTGKPTASAVRSVW